MAGAYDLYVDTLAQGVDEKHAAELASVGFLAGLSPEDTARLAAAGLRPETPTGAKSQADKIYADPKVKAELDAITERNARSRAGGQAILEAGLIQEQMKSDPRYLEKLAGVSQDAMLWERAKEMGLLKPGADIKRIDELRREYANLQRRVWQTEASVPGHPEHQPLSESERMRMDVLAPLIVHSKRLAAGGVPDLEGSVQASEHSAMGGDDRFASWATPAEPREFTRHTQTVINNVQNVGTVFMAPANPGKPSRWPLADMSKTPLGPAGPAGR